MLRVSFIRLRSERAKVTTARDSSWCKEIAIERFVGDRLRDDERERGREKGRDRILTEGMRIHRHPCRVVGDGSNRDQLVCKSHVNIAHSPGTEASEASRSIPRALDTSFSLVSAALVRFYTRHPLFLFLFLFLLLVPDRRAPKRRNQSRDKVSTKSWRNSSSFLARSFSTPRGSRVPPSPLLIFSFSTRPDTGEFTRHRISLTICRQEKNKFLCAGSVFLTFELVFFESSVHILNVKFSIIVEISR